FGILLSGSLLLGSFGEVHPMVPIALDSCIAGGVTGCFFGWLGGFWCGGCVERGSCCPAQDNVAPQQPVQNNVAHLPPLIAPMPAGALLQAGAPMPAGAAPQIAEALLAGAPQQPENNGAPQQPAQNNVAPRRHLAPPIPIEGALLQDGAPQQPAQNNVAPRRHVALPPPGVAL
ncbi:MAG: hypothetical protein LBJ71_00230, partial [Holosporaceae bacterium]|nr:hypothetical protein [Holosporaceae bacterium]